jgi:hypothetical protein
MNNAQNPDSLGQLKLQWTVSCAALLILLGVGTTFAFSKVKNEEVRAIYNFGSSVTTAVATGISAFYLFQSIRHNTLVNQKGIEQANELNEERNREIVLNRTLSYISRWNSTEYMTAKKVATEAKEQVEGRPLTDKQKEDILDQYINSTPRRKQEIAHIFNFLEELCIALNRNLIDEELIKDFFRSIVASYCTLFSIYIAKRRRSTGNDQLYKALTDVAASWKNGNGSA